MTNSRRRFLQLTFAAVGLALTDDLVASLTRPLGQVVVEKLDKLPNENKKLLDAMTTRHRRRSLPFNPHMTPGFSEILHRMHFERHYSTYHLRWETGERAMLRNAQLVTEKQMTSASFLALHDTMRVSANMVVLHDIYWSHLHQVQNPSRVEPPFAPIAFPKSETEPAWYLVSKNSRGEIRPVFVQDFSPIIPPGEEIIFAIDLANHAWDYDFGELEGYQKGLTQILTEPAWDIYKEYSVKPLDSFSYMTDAGSDFGSGTPPATEADLAKCVQQLLEGREDLADLEPEKVARGLRLAIGKEGRVLIGTLSPDDTAEIVLYPKDAAAGVVNFKASGYLEGLAS